MPRSTARSRPSVIQPLAPLTVAMLRGRQRQTGSRRGRVAAPPPPRPPVGTTPALHSGWMAAYPSAPCTSRSRSSRWAHPSTGAISSTRSRVTRPDCPETDITSRAGCRSRPPPRTARPLPARRHPRHTRAPGCPGLREQGIGVGDGVLGLGAQAGPGDEVEDLGVGELGARALPHARAWARTCRPALPRPGPRPRLPDRPARPDRAHHHRPRCPAHTSSRASGSAGMPWMTASRKWACGAWRWP